MTQNHLPSLLNTYYVFQSLFPGLSADYACFSFVIFYGGLHTGIKGSLVSLNDPQNPFERLGQFSEDLQGGAVFRVAGKPPLEYRWPRLHVSLP